MAIGTLKQKDRTIEILLVEDNYGDALLFKKAIERSSFTANTTVVEDGEQAVAMLVKSGDFSDAVTPDLVFLDINLPKLNGKEVLMKVKADDRLKHIPIIVFTSSVAHMDVVRSYQLNANAYVLKPSDLSKLSDIIRGIEAFWFDLAVLADSRDVDSL